MKSPGRTVPRQRRAREKYRATDYREKLDCITLSDRTTLRQLRRICASPSFSSFDMPPSVLVNTWQARSEYVPGSPRKSGYIVLDLQEANRHAHFLKSKHATDPFSCFMDYVAFSLEQLLHLQQYASARTLLEKFETLRPRFFDGLVSAPRREADLDKLEQLPALIHQYQSEFLIPFLLGHETGHHLSFQCPEEVVATRSLAKQLFTQTSKSLSMYTGIVAELELHFSEGELIWVRNYRGGHADMMNGLRERVDRYRIRNEHDSEPFCDFCGLSFAADRLLCNGSIENLLPFWMTFAEASEVLYYLFYLANDFYPSPDAPLRFFSADTRRRFVTAWACLAQRLDQSPVVKAFSWKTSKRKQIRKRVRDSLKEVQQSIETLSFVLMQTVLGTLQRSRKGRETSLADAQADLHAQVDVTTFDLLFSNVSPFPNWLLGFVYALDMLHDVVAVRFRDSQTSQTLSDAEINQLRERVVSLRPDWRAYVRDRINELTRNTRMERRPEHEV